MERLDARCSWLQRLPAAFRRSSADLPGNSYPSTDSTTFTDRVADLAQYRYFVRPLNLHGQEGKEVFVDITAGPVTTIFLPLVRTT
jgi:hypothetical protein